MMQIEQTSMHQIIKGEKRKHLKASETYIDVVFRYKNGILLNTSIPIEYRRTGINIPQEDEKQIDEYISKVYEEISPDNWDQWRTQQDLFWAKKPKASITKEFFDILQCDFTYKCSSCELPQNPNWARRIQDLKEFGYTISTRLSCKCTKCNKMTTQLILLPLARGGITGYETWSAKLRTRIVKILKNYDAFEAKQTKNEVLLPDHKFSEIRWDSKTKRDSLENLTDKEILNDFQLMSNQRNQQKREICRNCYQTGKRGIIYGISFFYEGTEDWDNSIPKNGKEAEKGCVGCGWYDIEFWRKELIKKIHQNS